jgi:translocation protein SEC63
MLLIAGGWALFSYLTYTVINTPVDIKVWDPYEVMELSTSATLPEIKKKYKKLSLQFHPDKVDEEDREASNERFVDISKAYKVLTDEDTRRNYEEWGHPDGKQAYTLGIALPLWIIEAGNGNWALLVYGLSLGFFLPFLVGRWWYKSQKYTKDNIHNKSMAVFFKEVKPNSTVRHLVEVLSVAFEFKEECDWTKRDDALIPALADKAKQEIETKASGDRFERSRKHKSPYVFKAYTLLQAHLHRVHVDDATLREQQQWIVQKSTHLVLGILEICLSRGWLETSMRCMEVSQMLVQACTQNDSVLLQLPHVNQDLLPALRSRKRQIRSVHQLVGLADEEKKSVLSELSADQAKELLQVADEHPFMDIPQAIFRTIGDPVITPGSIVTFLVKLRARPTKQIVDMEKADQDDMEDALDDEEADKIMMTPDAKLKSTKPVGYVHAPHFPANKKPYWWVIFGDLRNNGMITSPEKVTNITGDVYVKFQFQAPNRTGVFPFTVFVKSDSYMGLDVKRDVRLVVEDGDGQVQQEIYNDDISEPEEDSIAGQMAAMRNPNAAAGGQKGARQARDSDTSDDEE